MKPLPCPGCQRKTIRIFRWDERTYYGECLGEGCRMSGPIGSTEAEAQDKWNRLPRKENPNG